jgi:hypothetical protein
LMGTEVELRKNFIQTHAKFVKDLDVWAANLALNIWHLAFICHWTLIRQLVFWG